MSLWLDYSFARPSIPQMKKDGVVGVLRYLAPDDANNGGKILRPAERDALLGVGIDIALNWEWYAGRCLDGYGAGVQDARAAEAEAVALGYPAGKTIYFSHDTGQFNQSVLDYFRGVKDTLRRYKSGGYGGIQAIRALHSAGLIVDGWQTIAWSNGQRDPWAEIYQTGEQWYGGAADVDVVTSTDIGSWLDGPAVGGTFMPDLTPAQQQQLYDRVMALPVNSILNTEKAVAHARTDIWGTAKAVDLAALATTVNDLDVRIASLQKQVDGLQAGTGQVDLTALAKAVADEEAKRLSNG